jgi:O-antigen/teichoic acid export membrane protein
MSFIRKELSAPMKASIWFMIASFFQKGVAIITVPLFTRILTTYDYGVVSLYTSWKSLLSIIVTLALANTVYNNGLLDFDKQKEEFTSAILGLVTTSTLLFLFIFHLFSNEISTFFSLDPELVYIMFISILTDSALFFWMAQNRFEYKYKLSVSVVIFASLISPIFSYIAIVILPGSNASAKIFGSAIAGILINTIIFISLFVKGKKFFELKYWRYVLKINIPLIPHYLAGIVLSQSDRIMIANISGEEKAGIYAVAYSAASLIQIAWSAINASWVPWTFKNLRLSNYQEIYKKTKGLLVLSMIVTIALILFAPEAIKLLAPEEYYEGIYVIPPVVLGLYFTFIGNVTPFVYSPNLNY